MNILFLLRSLDIGGLEVVTSVLANKFFKEGHGVSVFAFEERTGLVKDRFDERIHITVGHRYQMSRENVVSLREVLLKNKVDIVVNQWGLPLIPIKVLLRAKRDLDVRVISVYHNDPLQNGRLQSVKTEIDKTENIVLKAVLKIKWFVFRCVTGYSMRYIYQHSDCYEVLSPSFVNHFKQFTKQNNINKLRIQTNPVTLGNEGYVYNPDFKTKEILYVGRVDYTQKRVHRVIETWAQLEYRFPDWRLTIVGDGEERANMEHMVRDLELQNVSFEGFQSPRSYYERGAMLMLTSEFEGFPLVLAECMSYGVVPVVYGSYSAVYDIIENGKDGAVIEQNLNGFNAAIMAERMAEIMFDSNILKAMALAAIKKSKNYAIDIIYGQWNDIMLHL